ncbi:MAG: GGDEF domain-containing protein [Erysipelotrichaceae bacterium]|nr:GGDEF domain-containing protein [Erysipelotrichaceae bacterium]
MSEKTDLAREYMHEARMSFYDGNLEVAAKLAQNAIDILNDSDDYYNTTIALNLLGVMYQTLGDDSKGMDYYLKGLQIAEEHNLSSTKTLFYNNIGTSYFTFKDYQKTYEYCLLAEEAINTEEAQKDERYQVWAMVTYLNLFNACLKLERYDEADKYMNLATSHLKHEENAYYMLGYRICQNSLYWATDRKDLARANLPQLIEHFKTDTNISDIVENATSFAALLKDMKEYGYWRELLESYMKRIDGQHSNSLEMAGNEFWIDYYKTIGDEDNYLKECINHTKLYFKQKELNNKNQVTSIDIKIALQKKESERKKAETLSNIDALTGLGNRHAHHKELIKLMKKEGDFKIGLGIVDIDYFKQINDTYGHLEGDNHLKQLADILKSLCTKGIKAYRIGGDEFLIIFKNCDRDTVEKYANNLKNALERAKIKNENSKVADYLTVSGGFVLVNSSDITSMESVLNKADTLLYQVKEGGRNNFKISD